MVTREEKIKALIKSEFLFLLNNPDCLDLEVDFFLAGGFGAFGDAQIDRKYREELGA